MITMADKMMLRTLALQYMEMATQPTQQQRKTLWKMHNSFKRTSIPIYVRACAWFELPESKCQSQDPFWHSIETFFRLSLLHSSFEDDSIFEPWLSVPAVYVTPAPGEWGGIWGMPVTWIGSENGPGAKRWDPPLKEIEDIKKLVRPHHVIDEKATVEKLSRVTETLGDIIPIVLDRAPLYRMWNGDISTQLAQLRGIQQLMLDMVDRPEWLHELLSFMRDGILTTHQEAEQAGDWKLCNHENQAMSYAEELPAPSPDATPVRRNQLWYYCASQELTLVGPQMFDEFMLQYQLPIMKQFGLVAYGCCENLTQKIGLLRQIPNLRRIAVSPFADVKKCAEQIGDQYIVSYRPSPADMVSYGFDPDLIRSILKRDLEVCDGCFVDITLKDVETVQGEPDRIRKWVTIARSVIEDVCKR
jgi:hypothetical protein